MFFIGVTNNELRKLFYDTKILLKYAELTTKLVVYIKVFEKINDTLIEQINNEFLELTGGKTPQELMDDFFEHFISILDSNITTIDTTEIKLKKPIIPQPHLSGFVAFKNKYVSFL